MTISERHVEEDEVERWREIESEVRVRMESEEIRRQIEEKVRKRMEEVETQRAMEEEITRRLDEESLWGRDEPLSPSLYGSLSGHEKEDTGEPENDNSSLFFRMDGDFSQDLFFLDSHDAQPSKDVHMPHKEKHTTSGETEEPKEKGIEKMQRRDRRNQRNPSSVRRRYISWTTTEDEL
mmetsp:Transcript_26511/g.67841  ORF Transcript_26511/g.67841 Transcript_26511/m.67841 type:complete len:179 (-) Transcript_26511:1638-2174(-)